jgi:hypothetical protein
LLEARQRMVAHGANLASATYQVAYATPSRFGRDYIGRDVSEMKALQIIAAA